ncbi:MAG TPA: 4-hydroxythreonine-4-phosphate dehydrogenase PdxA [Pseudonocardia sp.]|uniref:PdxA family dehydrogenase n=1 Tax=Pseudonocardia sp. TaxID=60912 RepID=UPI002CAC9AFA|nr:4-hydroxythreonine-4-phosphate dehydrogenase PdxA [Pseudonocardia sp.]HTF55419.1 4-hydroxythreonine-4-phosphate dehydrogenase PdxA [Pseudonocardia sp.]
MSRVLLCVGDPNGVGPELAVAAAAALDGDPELAPVLVADRHVVAGWAELAGLRVREVARPVRALPGVLDLLPVDALPSGSWCPGQVSGDAGAATVAYVQTAMAAVQAGFGRAVVACPHSETAVNAAGLRFDGYPGLLADLAGVPRERVFLMLVGGGLRVVHATLHEGLADALRRLTPELITSACLAAADYLRGVGIGAPRIAVCGINPHAGEHGLFGEEDERITRPAVAALRAGGVDADGPLGADLLFAPGRRDEFHAHLAMYHDQGHVPVKALAGRRASAVSLGAGLVFCSVGHGAAFDIAGAGRADPSAVLDAIRLVGARIPAVVP